MKKAILILLGILVVIFLVHVFSSTDAATTTGIFQIYNMYDDRTIVSEPEYSDEYVNIWLAKSEEKIIMTAKLNNNNVEAVYYYGPGQQANYYSKGSTELFKSDEISLDAIEVPTLSIYSDGFIAKDPVISYGFNDSNNIPVFDSVSEAREYLLEQKE